MFEERQEEPLMALDVEQQNERLLPRPLLISVHPLV